jgi:carbon-monoxide dehydrogenase catalytic subunit
MPDEEKVTPKKVVPKKKELDPRDLTTCEATAMMIAKARNDGVELAFDRATNMKACPIGADSACCKHCFMGPCPHGPRHGHAGFISRGFGRQHNGL